MPHFSAALLRLARRVYAIERHKELLEETQKVPKALLEQLAVGGIMIIPVGASVADQMLLRITRTPESYDTQHLMPVRFVPLVEE